VFGLSEARWLASTNPELMLLHMASYRASERQFRLFACACCRRVWEQITCQEGRTAVQIAEHYADGAATLRELESAHDAAWQARGSPATTAAADASQAACGMEGAWQTASHAAWAWAENRTRAEELEAQARLLRDIFSFRPPAIDRSWLHSKGGCGLKIAQTVYAERRFNDVPILADALEDAGCTNTNILDHCRQPSEHVRGCWVVDLLLGKR
jgi:hypothetical protein